MIVHLSLTLQFFTSKLFRSSHEVIHAFTFLNSLSGPHFQKKRKRISTVGTVNKIQCISVIYDYNKHCKYIQWKLGHQ